VGKPEPSLFAKAREALGNRAHVAMVGDHLIADIAGARYAGLPTILVLSGVTARRTWKAPPIARAGPR
jgi:glycerol-1-phosphatase